MGNALKNSLLGGGSLLLAEGLTGGIGNGAVSSTIGHTANAVMYGLENVGDANHLLEEGVAQIGLNAPLAANATSILGNFMLPGVLGLGSAYVGWKTYKNQGGLKGAYNGVERSALIYGGAGVIGGGIGLLSAPFVAPVLAGGLGMYGVKKLAQAANDNVSKINPMNLIKKEKDKAA